MIKIFNVPTRKFITIVSVLAWLFLTLYMLVIAPFFPVINMELLQIVWGGFTGFMGLIVGFYFGKSTALEMPKIAGQPYIEYAEKNNASSTDIANKTI